MRYLLNAEKFPFMLTCKFNSDPIESLLKTLRMPAACNDTLDVRDAFSGLDKLLDTGIAA